MWHQTLIVPSDISGQRPLPGATRWQRGTRKAGHESAQHRTSGSLPPNLRAGKRLQTGAAGS